MIVGICDDEQDCQFQIENLIRQQPCTENVEVVLFSTLQQLSQYKKKMDILFLDIELEENSLEYLSNHKELITQLGDIVLISAYSYYVTNSYRVPVSQYLLKPMLPDQFAHVFRDCCQRYQHLKGWQKLRDEYGELWHIPLSQIIMIRSVRHQILYYDINLCMYNSTETSLTAVARKLNLYGFCQVTKNVLVHLDFVKEIKEKQMILEINEREIMIPIGKKYIETVKQQHFQYLIR